MPATATPLWALLSLVLLALSAVANDAVHTDLAPTPVHVHHRVHLPGQAPAPFTPKGTVLLTPNGPSYAPAAAFRDELTTWAASNNPHARYEVALETEESPDTWPRSSVKLCYVTAAKDEYFTMHKSVSGDVFALDYHLSSVPKDGACPSAPASLFIASTDIILKSPSPAFSPRLKTPPPLGADGQTIKPVVEKSFIQKYWMYIVPVLILLLVMPGGPEEGGQQ
ncbi:hypothetical protein BDV93DRAFT_521776 [Ceratobasidium sp. AG-I]|nr:hypothetical protein BDV93DRAFT_521776 [Ceratobasidium sp. AG-I]